MDFVTSSTCGLSRPLFEALLLLARLAGCCSAGWLLCLGALTRTLQIL